MEKESSLSGQALEHRLDKNIVGRSAGPSPRSAATDESHSKPTVSETTISDTTGKSEAAFHNYPVWSPRFWHGMLLRDWLRLLARNRFSIHPTRIPMSCAITAFATCNSVLYQLQKLIYGRRVNATQIEEAPVFILGHWRSGTTYLHELMVLDEQFTYPTTYQCFAPNHFLLTQWLVTRWMRFLLPSRRPMDNMALGWNLPQEDEFALCNMGVPSPNLRMAFPNHPPVHVEYLEADQLDDGELERWKRALMRFMRLVTFRTPRRLIMKSPTHTGRIKPLSEMFPEARFVHIVRDPYVLFPSTIRLWKALYSVQGLQLHDGEGLEQYVFDSLDRMYRGFQRQREQIDPARICDVRYEDLVRDPVGQVGRVYERLDLGDFSTVRSKLQAYVQDAKEYQPNRYELPPELRAQITQRWGDYIDRYGYRAATTGE